jgi:SynChlorMet cassette radical SAM/SPASM protein ScmF
MMAYPLNQLYFYLTEGCNLACRHCWLAPKFDAGGDRTGNGYASLSLHAFETAIREAKPLGLNTIKLTGGEPLMHPELSHMLDIVRHEDLGLVIETNGLLCSHEIAAKIAELPWRFVSISIDGADVATHDWVRGVEGSFDAACHAVRNLVATGTRPQIICSVMRINAGQVEAVVRLAEKLGAASVKFNIIQPTARGERLHSDGGVLGVDELIELGRWVETELASASPLSLFFDYPLAFRPLSRMANAGGCDVCGIFGILGVIPHGDDPCTAHYALCGIGEQIPELVFGTVDVDPLETVWRDNPTINTIRDGMPDDLAGICSSCLMKYRCLGSCVAQNYYRSGYLFAPFWFCEQAEAAGLFPRSRLRP